MRTPLAELEDCALIEMALGGQAECFRILMDRHIGAVKRCLGGMLRNPSDAEDVLQEVLLKVWRGLSTFRAESSFRTWVTRVAINEALMLYRRDQAKPPCQELPDLSVLACSEEPVDQALIRDERAQAVRRAVVGLPQMYRQALILRELDQLSLQETARRLHASVPAVKTRVFRGRLMLSAALQRSGNTELLRAA